SKGKGKKKQFKNVTVEELAVIYFVVESLHIATGEAFLGYRQASDQYKQILGRSASPNLISYIFKTLRTHGLLLAVQKGNWDDGTATVYLPTLSILAVGRSVSAGKRTRA